MLAMNDEAATPSNDRKLKIVKTTVGIIALVVVSATVFCGASMAVVVAVVLFFALGPYAID